MKLSRKVDQALGFVVAISLLVVFGVLICATVRSTFAESDGSQNTYLTTSSKFVTFYDDGAKLTVKTDAKTVSDALDRAGITINSGDIVEPGLDAEINADNFFVNIYRARPVMVEDGNVIKYAMTASRDLKTIASEVGLALYDDDEMKLVQNTNFLEAGMVSVYKIIRNGGRVLTVEEELPFTERTEKDYNLAPGVSEVRQLGEVGTKKAIYNVLYMDGKEVSRELVSEEIIRDPVERVVAVGASPIEQNPLTPVRGRNYYTYTKPDGVTVLRQETFYDLNMSVVMRSCGGGSYSVREDGVKVDQDGYVLVAANLSLYPRCSVVETSLGAGKVYDTGSFAEVNPEQFDLATDWSNHDGI